MRYPRRKTSRLFFLIFAVFALPLQTFPCLILKIAHGNAVLAGNNEDIDNPLSRIWFEPPEKGKYGITYFGYTANYPQGGMNDRGLFFDGVAGYKTDWKASPQRLDYEGILFRKIMEECATVEEAVAVFHKYNFSAFQRARIFLADRSGASAIVGWIDGDVKAIRDQGNFQAVGFREETAISMLKAIKERREIVRVDEVKEILEACHQEGRYPTQYSNICDLKNNVVTMFLFHDYSAVVKFNANEEYQKGKHDYPLLSYFPNNVKAREARKTYGQMLLDSFEKINSHADGTRTPWGRDDLTRLGMRLLDFQEYRKAVEVLKIAAERFPVWRSFDNLAFAYETAGDIDLAIESYKKVLQLDPGNQGAAESIKKLSSRQADFPKLTGPYLGQKPPGMMPEIFAPGIVSTDMYNHCTVSISPDGSEIYWAMAPLDAPRRIYFSKNVNGTWTRPEIVNFTQSDDGDCPVLSPDGKKLFFNSNRPLPQGTTRRERIWCAERTATGWGAPFPLGPEINDEHLHWQVSVDAGGNLYFGSERAGSKGRDDVFMAEFVNGAYRKPVSLGPEINSKVHEDNPFIAPDGSYLIFCRDRLWISFRKNNGSWTEAKNMGGVFKGAGCPYVSPDQKYFFFLKMGQDSNDIWWVDAKIIEEMRPKELREN